MKAFNKWVNALTGRGFLLFQLGLALILAAGGSCCILLIEDASSGINAIGLMAAVIVCMGIPLLLQKAMERRMKRLNYLMAGALGIVLLVDLLTILL